MRPTSWYAPDQLIILPGGLAFHHDVERRRLAGSMRLGVLDGRFELLGRRSLGGSDPFEGRKHAVKTSGAAERSPRWPAPADPDRRPGPLDRHGQEQALVNAVMTPLVRKRLATPQAADDVESLIDQFVASARVRILAEGGELLAALRAESRPRR